MSIVEFLDQHAGDAAACVIFDTAMLDDDTPVFYDRRPRHALPPRRGSSRASATFTRVCTAARR